MPEDVEIRCPRPPRKLFAKLVRDAQNSGSFSTLIEFACADCAKRLRREGQDVFRVLHRYDIDGSLVDTLVTLYDDIVERR